MAAWATPKQAPKPRMRAIIAEEREVAGDDELREALAASRREADQLAARIVDAETAEPAGGPAADASLALALALQDEEERGAAHAVALLREAVEQREQQAALELEDLEEGERARAAAAAQRGVPHDEVLVPHLRAQLDDAAHRGHPRVDLGA